MATTPRWNGGETAIVQEDRLTPGGTIEADDRFKVTLSDPYGHSNEIDVAAGGTTVADVITAVVAAAVAAKAAFTRPWSEVTVTDETTYIKIMADTAGVPFTSAPVTTEAGGGAADDQTFTGATQTANVGPNDFLTPENYEENVVPVSTDSVRVPAAIANTANDIAGGDYSSGRALADFDVEPNCNLNIGSKVTPLKLDVVDVRFAGRGNTYLHIINNTGTFRVDYAKAATSGNSFGLHIQGATIADMILDPGSEGSIGIGVFDGATTDITVLKALSGNLTLGEQLTTLGTLHALGATIEGLCAASIANIVSGTMRQVKGALATINLRNDATLKYNSTSLPTTVNLYDSCVLDLSESHTAWGSGITINWYGGSSIIDTNLLIDYENLTAFNVFRGGTLSIS